MNQDASASGAQVDPYAIPEAICGETSAVHRKCRRLAKAAVRAGRWDTVMVAEPFIAIEHAPRRIFLSDVFWRAPGENVYACFLWRDIINTIRALQDDPSLPAASAAEYAITRDLILDGMNCFWFCLCVLGHGSAWFPPIEPYKTESKALATTMLQKLHAWWPKFIELDERFEQRVYGRWNEWGHVVGELLFQMGRSKDEIVELYSLPAIHAGRQLEDLLRSVT